MLFRNLKTSIIRATKLLPQTNDFGAFVSRHIPFIRHLPIETKERRSHLHAQEQKAKGLVARSL